MQTFFTRIMGIILIGIFFGTFCDAYIPPSFFVVRQIAKRHSELNNLKIKNKVTFVRSNLSVFETIWVHHGNNVRVIITGASGATVGQVNRNLESKNLPFIYDLSLVSSGTVIFDHFRNLGIPLKSEAALYGEKDPEKENLPYKIEETIALGRFNGRTAIVLNGNGRDFDPPQIWVEKDNYLPLRAIFKPPGSSETLTVQFTDYHVYKATLLPKLIEVLKDGSPWARIELMDVDTATTPSTEHKTETTETGEVQSYLEQYLKWIR